MSLNAVPTLLLVLRVVLLATLFESTDPVAGGSDHRAGALTPVAAAP
jgi:hypothetical protein